jgi:hypothetical protein
MNKKDLALNIRSNKSLIEYSDRSHVNCVRVGIGNSLKHELSKFFVGWILANGGDVRILFPLFKTEILDKVAWNTFEKIYDQWCFKGSERNFICEARFMKSKERADVFCLESGERIEVETDKKRAERFKDKKGVLVLEV